MKAAKNLGHDELVRIAEAVQGLLWFDESEKVFDPDKEWSGADICEALSELCSELDLIPYCLGDEPEEPRDNCEICGSSPH